MKTLLVPVDFSAATNATVSTAVGLARACSGEIILLHIIATPDDYRAYPTASGEMWEIEKTRVQQKLDDLVLEVSEQGVVASSRLVSGEPVERIVLQAQLSAADVIVMGSRGHTAIYDLLVGSTTSGVLKAAVCPVLLAPTEKLALQEIAAG